MKETETYPELELRREFNRFAEIFHQLATLWFDARLKELKPNKEEPTIKPEKETGNLNNNDLTISHKPPTIKEQVEDQYQTPEIINLMDIKQAAEYLNLHKATLYRLNKHKIIPHTKIKNRVTYKKIDLDEYKKNPKKRNYIPRKRKDRQSHEEATA